MKSSDIFTKAMALARLEREQRNEKLNELKEKWIPVWQALYQECQEATNHQLKVFEETYSYCEFCGYTEMLD